MLDGPSHRESAVERNSSRKMPKTYLCLSKIPSFVSIWMSLVWRRLRLSAISGGKLPGILHFQECSLLLKPRDRVFKSSVDETCAWNVNLKMKIGTLGYKVCFTPSLVPVWHLFQENISLMLLSSHEARLILEQMLSMAMRVQSPVVEAWQKALQGR